MENPKIDKDEAQSGGELMVDAITGDVLGSPDPGSPDHGGRFGNWSRQALLVGGVSLGALILVIIGLVWFWSSNRRITLNDALVRGETVPVVVPIEGKILSMSVAEGDHVKAGQVVAQLQNSQVKSQIAEAQGLLRKAESERSKGERGLDDLKKRVPLELNQAVKAVEVSRARIREAEARMRSGPVEADRAYVVTRSGPQYVMEKHAREFSRKTAKAELKAAKEELRRSEARLRAVKAKKELMEAKQRFAIAAKARLERAQSSLDAARNKLAATTLSTPVSGVVSKRSFNEGDPVKSGDTVAVVVDVTRLWLEATVSEADLKNVSIGQTADVKFDAYPDKSWPASVAAIGSPLSQAPGSPAQASSFPPDGKSAAGIPLKFEFAQPAPQVSPGMKARITIEAGKS